MKTYDLIIIGAGPAGMFAGITAASHDKKVLLLEKNKKLGKKLLIAGHGRCNLTNSRDFKEFFSKYGDGGRFLKSALNSFKPKDLIDWFQEHGLKLTLVEESGKYFPHTMRSLDVLELLEREMKKNRVEIILDCDIKDIQRNRDENLEEEDVSTPEIAYTVVTGRGEFTCRNLLIATGGASYPATGTTGDGYRYGKNLGHKIVAPKPSLTPVYVDNYVFGDLSGISFSDVKITLYREGKKLKETEGDLLFTHHNLSGPGIIDFSRYVNKDDLLGINFIGITKENFQEAILKEAERKGKRNIKNFLLDYKLPERFVKKILQLLEIDESKKLSEISKKERGDIIQIADYRFRVTRLGGMDIAMATAGGISLDEINPKTMESKICRNLYFAGEVTDIDGDTGGYNIQAAFSMGYLAAKSILKKI